MIAAKMSETLALSRDFQNEEYNLQFQSPEKGIEKKKKMGKRQLQGGMMIVMDYKEKLILCSKLSNWVKS